LRFAGGAALGRPSWRRGSAVLAQERRLPGQQAESTVRGCSMSCARWAGGWH